MVKRSSAGRKITSEREQIEILEAKISINNKQFQRWCKYKNEVNCTCDSDALQILLDQWYSAALDKVEVTVEKEHEEINATNSWASDRQPTCTEDGVPEGESLRVEGELPHTTGSSSTESPQTVITNIPLKMEVDDDAYNEGHEDTEIERVLTPSVLVTAAHLKTERENTWTQKFCVISNCKQARPPTPAEIEKLNAQGLGEKSLTFKLDENPKTFRENLLLCFPRLKEAEGFELCRRRNGSSLEMISEPPGGFTTSYLAGKNELNGIVCYVRPTVRNIKGIQFDKRPRNDLSYAQKLKVIELLEQGKKQKEVSRIIGCSQTQVSQTSRNKDQIRQRFNQNPARRRSRSGKAKAVEQALADWHRSVFIPGKYIPSEILMEKAKELAAKIGNNDFKPNKGWLSRWKSRFNIPMVTKRVYKKTGAENEATNEEETNEDHGLMGISHAVSQSRDGLTSQQAEFNETSLSSEDLSRQCSGSTEEESFVSESEMGTENQTQSLRSNTDASRKSLSRGKTDLGRERMMRDSRFSKPHKRKDLSLKEQMLVLDMLDQKLTQAEIARKFGCSQANISVVAGRRDKICAQYRSAENHDRRRERSGKSPDVESALFAWYQSIQDQEPGKQVTNQMLKKQAEALAVELGMSPFTTSNGWLYRWKQKHNMLIKQYKKRTPNPGKTKTPVENTSLHSENSLSEIPDSSTEVPLERNMVSPMEDVNTNVQSHPCDDPGQLSVESTGQSQIVQCDTNSSNQPSAIELTSPAMNTQIDNRVISTMDVLSGTRESESRGTAEQQLETQKLLATAFLHSLNVLAPDTSTPGRRLLPPQLSDTAQQLASSMLQLCQGPNRQKSSNVYTQLKEPVSTGNVVGSSEAQSSQRSAVQTGDGISEENKQRSGATGSATGSATSSQAQTVSSSTSKTFDRSFPAQPLASTSSSAPSRMDCTPVFVPEKPTSSTSVSCKPTSSTSVSCKPSSSSKRSAIGISKTSSKGESISARSELTDEPWTPRYSTRRRTTNTLVHRLAEEESDFDDSDDDPNWEGTDEKEDEKLSSDSEDCMKSDEEEEEEDFRLVSPHDSKQPVIERTEKQHQGKGPAQKQRPHDENLTASEAVSINDDANPSLYGVMNQGTSTGTKTNLLSDEKIEINVAKSKPPNRRSFTSKFKMEVLAYAEVAGNRAAGRKFNVRESAVRQWRKKKEELRSSKLTQRRINPRRSTWPDLEALLKSWMVEQRDWGNVLSVDVLRKQSKTFAEMLKIEGFQGSRMWVANFLTRNDISLKRIDEKQRYRKMEIVIN